jgi:hypothetical protein
MKGSGRGVMQGTIPPLEWGTEENNENLNQDSRFPGRDLNPGPPEYEAAVLTIRPIRLVSHC